MIGILRRIDLIIFNWEHKEVVVKNDTAIETKVILNDIQMPWEVPIAWRFHNQVICRLG